KVTGTKAYTLLGFYVPTKREDPKWSYDEEKTFTAQEKMTMKFGTEVENRALIMYLQKNPETTAQMVGWCPAPSPLPRDWGASPDGLVYNPLLNWSDMPETFSQETHPKFDPIRGALEIKSSPHSLNI